MNHLCLFIAESFRRSLFRSCEGFPPLFMAYGDTECWSALFSALIWTDPLPFFVFLDFSSFVQSEFFIWSNNSFFIKICSQFELNQILFLKISDFCPLLKFLLQYSHSIKVSCSCHWRLFYLSSPPIFIFLFFELSNETILPILKRGIIGLPHCKAFPPLNSFCNFYALRTQKRTDSASYPHIHSTPKLPKLTSASSSWVDVRTPPSEACPEINKPHWRRADENSMFADKARQAGAQVMEMVVKVPTDKPNINFSSAWPRSIKNNPLHILRSSILSGWHHWPTPKQHHSVLCNFCLIINSKTSAGFFDWSRSQKSVHFSTFLFYQVIASNNAPPSVGPTCRKVVATPLNRLRKSVLCAPRG